MKNLVLLGFMGSGKTAVGRMASSELGLKFVDMDRVIEERAGLPVPEIFAQWGEPDFRDLEARTAEELASRMGLAVATGGGVVLRASNLEALGSTGVLVCLHVDAATALARTRGNARQRPLLKGDDPLKKIQDLLRERQPLYDAILNGVNTVGRTVKDVCADVVRIYRAAQTES